MCVCVSVRELCSNMAAQKQFNNEEQRQKLTERDPKVCEHKGNILLISLVLPYSFTLHYVFIICVKICIFYVQNKQCWLIYYGMYRESIVGKV